MLKTTHVDKKSTQIKYFSILANFLWRRAYYLSKNIKNGMETITVVDPCMGGGKLLGNIPQNWQGVGFESDYTQFKYAEALFNKPERYNVGVKNQPFEFHFSAPHFPQFDFAISIPYVDRPINANLEKDEYCYSFKSYAYYCIYRSIGILNPGGYIVFALPKELVTHESYKEDLDRICSMGVDVKTSETYRDYAIVIIEKHK